MVDRSAGGFALAEAFVRIRPDADGFRAETDRDLKAQMAGDKVTVPVDAETAHAIRKVGDLQSILTVLNRRAYSARILVDDAGLQAQLAKITLQLLKVGKQVADPRITMQGAAEAEAVLLAIAAQMDKLSSKAAKLHVDIDDADAERRLALLVTELSALQQRMTSLQLKVEDPGALAKVAALKDALAGLHDQVFSLASTQATSSSFLIGLPSDAAIGHTLGVIQQKMKSLGLADIADVNVDPGRIATSLMRIKGLLARTPGAGGLPGLADLMDVNIPPGTILTQLARLKAALGKTNLTITDIMDVNLSPDQVQQAVAKVQKAFADIPATTVSPGLTLPSLAEVAALRNALGSLVDTTQLGKTIGAISQELKTGLGGLGDLFASNLTVTESVKAGVDNASWSAASKEIQRILDSIKLKALSGNIDQAELAGLVTQVQSKLDTLRIKALVVGVNQPELDTFVASVQAKLNTLKVPLAEFSVTDPAAIRTAESALAGLDAELRKITADAAGGGRGMRGVGLAAFGAGGWFGFLTGRVRLFGGAFAAIPLLGYIGTIHLLVDAVAEIIAVVVPAAVALAAFAAGAASTVADIAHSMQTANTAAIGLGQNIYPLTGQLQRLTDAVHPAVITLWGEALVVAGRDAGRFTKLAVDAGKVIDNLGARAAVALTSGGLTGFFKKGAQDLAVIGDIIGNIFGTIGNILKVVPGYAQILFGALDQLTKGLEAITGSPIGQWLLKIGLELHGAIIWIGLGVTAAVALGNALVGLAARFGLVEAGALAFDAVQFAAGAKLLVTSVGTMIAALIGFDTELTVTEAEAGVFTGVMDVLGSVNPFVWVGIAAAALGGLVYWLTRTTSATDAYNTAVKNSLGRAPVDELSVQIAQRMTETTVLLAGAQAKLATTTQFAATVQGTHDARIIATTDAYKNQVGVVQGYQGELKTLQGYQSNYNTLVKAAGGNLSAFAAVGITSNDIMGASAQQIKQYVIELQAQNLAFQSLALGAGRAAAAQNALGKAGAASFDYITSQLPQLQKITQAEDQLANVLLSGEQAFTGFQGSLVTLGTDLGVNAAKIIGFNTAQNQVASDIYGTVLPAFQKTIDSAQQMGVNTKDLTTITATQAGEFLKLAGGSTIARGTMVGLINDALGPGTVSLKTLDSWVKTNSTSQAGLNTLWGDATIKAGTLSGILQNSLNVQFHQALLQTSGASAALVAYTGNITHNTTQTAAGQSNRARLIQDLINSGLNAKTATAYVDGLSTSVGKLPSGKTIRVMVDVGAAGTISAKASGTLAKAAGLSQSSVNQIADLLTFGAAGMKVPGSGFGDTVPAMLTPGEAVVPKRLVPAIAPFLAAHNVPGFASGGIAGDLTLAGAYAGTDEAKWAASGGIEYAKLIDAAWQKKIAAALAARIAAQAAATAKAGLGNLPLGPQGPLSSSAAVAQAFARSILFAYGWTQAQFPALQALWNQESGWNSYAVNPSSGAYGIPQALGHGHPYNLGDYQSQIRWGLAYISARYGSPSAAWAHEVAFNWYKSGGLVPGLARGGYAGGGLATAQAGELAAYQKLVSATDAALAHPNAYQKANKVSITSELGTLGRRQAAEALAYKGTPARLAAAVRDEIGTASDARISKAEPALTAALRAALSRVITATGLSATTGATTGAKAAKPGSVAAAGGAATRQTRELAAYRALASATRAELAHPDAWLKANKVSVTSELATLARRQAAEALAYAKGTPATLAAAARSEARTAADKRLGTAEPALTKNLIAVLGQMSTVAKLTGKLPVSPAAHAGAAGVTVARSISPAAVSRLSPSGLTRAQYAADEALVHGLSLAVIRKSPHLEHIWHLLHLQHLADIGLGMGGYVADHGTTLSPGWNVRYNGTGRNETLVPDGSGKTDKLLQCLIDEMRANTTVTSQQGHKFASALNSVAGQAGQRGSYSTRR